MLRKIITGVGATVLAAGLLFSGLHLWHAGKVDWLIPTPRVAEPVSVQILGPEEIMAGGENYFVLDVKGEAGKPVVTLVPDTPNAMTVGLDGKTIRFQSEITGTYSIQVSVAGPGLQVASDHHEFENVAVVEHHDEPAAPPQNSAPPPPISFVPEQPPTVEQLVQQALDDVQSDHKVEEAKIVAGVVKGLMSRISTANIEPDSDVMLELEDGINLTLGERARAWGLFVAEIRTIVASLREQGAITTSATFVPTLRDIAAVLSRAK